MTKKKNGIVSDVADIVAGGVSLGVGSLTVGSIAGIGDARVAGIAGTAQAGLSLASVTLPLKGAKSVLKQLEKMR